jgi:hypothetical protein
VVALGSYSPVVHVGTYLLISVQVAAGWIPACKGVLGQNPVWVMRRVAFVVYKRRICRLPPWFSTAADRLKSEPRLNSGRKNRKYIPSAP